MSTPLNNTNVTPQKEETIKETAANTLPLDLAIIQAKCVNDLLHDISIVCFEKCAHKLSESSLGPGEFTCADRCTTQYYKAHLKLVQDLQNVNGDKKIVLNLLFIPLQMQNNNNNNTK